LILSFAPRPIIRARCSGEKEMPASGMDKQALIWFEV